MVRRKVVQVIMGGTYDKVNLSTTMRGLIITTIMNQMIRAATKNKTVLASLVIGSTGTERRITNLRKR